MNDFVKSIVIGIGKRELRAIAQAVTLVESTRPSDQLLADSLLSEIMPLTEGAIRLGISGIPGVGKSTFIEALGLLLIKKGKRVAVLAIDPSSPVSGGSILGDKTRMEHLAESPNSFIRPSPSRGSLGGVARKTRETSLLMEASGFDIVIIETVGVGQSEILVSSMVDVFLMLQNPNTGDELQTIKKGILEVADVVAVNKADGELLIPAQRAAAMLKGAFDLVATHESWSPPVVLCSAREGKNIDLVWNEIERFIANQEKTGSWGLRRQRQLTNWFDSEVSQQLVEQLTTNINCQAILGQAKDDAVSRKSPVPAAARKAVQELLKKA
jgi:LAO/AO transport system kinase